jgi:hypothetical protein
MSKPFSFADMAKKKADPSSATYVPKPQHVVPSTNIKVDPNNIKNNLPPPPITNSRSLALSSDRTKSFENNNNKQPNNISTSNNNSDKSSNNDTSSPHNNQQKTYQKNHSDKKESNNTVFNRFDKKKSDVLPLPTSSATAWKPSANSWSSRAMESVSSTNDNNKSNATNVTTSNEPTTSPKWRSKNKANVKNPNSSGYHGNSNVSRTVVIGDSFAGIFKLLKNNISVIKFKGCTMKGLARDGNENQIKLLQLLSNKKYECGIFSIGQVDLHLSFYYDLLVKKSTEPTDYKERAFTFVNFVSGIKGIGKKIILAVYPSPLETQFIKASLIAYGIVSSEDVDSFDKTTWDEMNEPEERFNRLQQLNNGLEEACLATNGKVQFLSINDQIMEGCKVKSDYIDVSQCNVHLLWEPLIDLWTKLINNHNITKDNLTDIESSSAAYLSEKLSRMATEEFKQSHRTEF